MACDTCGATYNHEQQLKKQNRDAAKKYAMETGLPVAIYQEAGEWKYGTVQFLQSEGIPFREVVSGHT